MSQFVVQHAPSDNVSDFEWSWLPFDDRDEALEKATEIARDSYFVLVGEWGESVPPERIGDPDFYYFWWNGYFRAGVPALGEFGLHIHSDRDATPTRYHPVKAEG